VAINFPPNFLITLRRKNAALFSKFFINKGRNPFLIDGKDYPIFYILYRRIYILGILR